MCAQVMSTSMSVQIMHVVPTGVRKGYRIPVIRVTESSELIRRFWVLDLGLLGK